MPALILGLIWLPGVEAGAADSSAPGVVWLTQDDFRYGTYIIDRPGTYRLAEDISFNPNSPEVLTEAIRSGELDAGLAAELGMPLPPDPVDAYHAGFPLPTQFAFTDPGDFTPGGPMDARYDPAGFGIGFFAAIAITTDDVVLDLNGYRLEQSAEHALLQRFFALVELADQPFLPTQGPHTFGADIESATNIVIRNGTMGRSSHHGVHGNFNENVTIIGVNFDGYEVGAVSLNGVKGLVIRHSEATNRKDVPVLGTFSSAQFIKPYVEHLVRSGSATTLRVQGDDWTATEIRNALQASINAVHHDIVVDPNVVDGRAQIDVTNHPDEYGVFSNPLGVVDGNSYSFLVNSPGVAVNGFPLRPDGVTQVPAEDVLLEDVHVTAQWAFINEIVAINQGGKAVIDPVGAVFQVRNLHPDTGEPLTVSSTDDSGAVYTGNVVANAQALVAKAFLNGDFANSPLDLSRLSITADVLRWVEGTPGYETLADLVPDEPGWLCNGDSMFHVNKGAIAFKLDAAIHVRLVDTSVSDIRNFGAQGLGNCGDYSQGVSHPAATLAGYGGAATRAYTFAGSEHVRVARAQADGVISHAGNAAAFDVFTDSDNVVIRDSEARRVHGGTANDSYGGPNTVPRAAGVHVGPDATRVRIVRFCATDLHAPDGGYVVDDESEAARLLQLCA